MSYAFEFVDQFGYFELVHTGEVDYAELCAARAEVAIPLRERNSLTLLVDVTHAEPKFTKVEIETFIKSHPEHFPADIKIAVVERPEHHEEHGKYAQEIAECAGIRQCFFKNRTSARAWLVLGGSDEATYERSEEPLSEEMPSMRLRLEIAAKKSKGSEPE